MPPREKGFVYLWALFAVTVAGIVMAGTGQVWQVKSQREKEAELMFIGEEFRKAIMSYYNTGTKQYPESLEDLLQDKRAPAIKRHLRKIYLDPLTNTAEWGLIEESPPGNNATSSPSAASGNPALNKNAASGNNPALNTQATPGSNATSGSKQAPNNNAAPSGAMPSSSLATSSINKRIIGVYSLSEKKPIKKDKFPEYFAKFSEAKTYQDWQFTYKPGSANAPGAPASTSNQPKPGAAAGSSSTASPFAPQSSPATTNASPFAPQSAPSAGSKSPPPGFPAAQ